MNATATKGMWSEQPTKTVTILFDTTHSPERITVHESGKNPIHFEYENGIGEAEILKVREFVKKTYNL